jgi:hypothetical protein
VSSAWDLSCSRLRPLDFEFGIPVIAVMGEMPWGEIPWGEIPWRCFPKGLLQNFGRP